MHNLSETQFRVTRTFLPEDETHQPIPEASWDGKRHMWIARFGSLAELLSLSRRENAEILVSSDELVHGVTLNEIEICDYGMVPDTLAR